MKWLLFAVDTVNKWVGRVVAYLVLIIIGITVWEVTARFLLNNPTTWVHETAGQLFGAYLMLGGGYVLLNKAHIRVDILWDRLSPRNKAIADLCTVTLFGLAFVSISLWYTGRMAWLSTQLLEHTLTPFGPPGGPLKIAVATGMFLLLLQLIAKIIRDLYLAITGDEYA
jgi:TRAP-type mannitol/chloroaromatic compound transport system permease small subunit